MREIENFSRMVNAKSFLINTEGPLFTPINQFMEDQVIQIRKILPNLVNYSQEVYQSLNFSSGNILAVKVTSNTLVCLFFDYQQDQTTKNQFDLINTLTKLTSISQIVYKLYTAQEAPQADIFVHNLAKDYVTSLDSDLKSPDCASYYAVETDIIKAIVYSNQENLIAALDQLPHTNFFNVLGAQKVSLREKKDFIVSYIAVLTRAIYQWGYPIGQAFKIQADLVDKIEHATQFPAYINTLRSIAWYFYKLIAAYRVHNFLPLSTRIKSYINEHISETITLDDIAVGVHASKKALNPAFKAEFGMTITQFIRQNKVSRAKEILVASDVTIPEVAAQLAFSKPSYFIKTFKNLTGMTPNFYRNNYLEA